MKLETALAKVAPRWHKDFLKFIETGEAQPEFLAYLDEDKNG